MKILPIKFIPKYGDQVIFIDFYYELFGKTLSYPNVNKIFFRILKILKDNYRILMESVLNQFQL